MSEAYILLEPAEPNRPEVNAERAETPPKSERLISLDAYRGFIMSMLAASGFGIARFARLPQDSEVWNKCDYSFWQKLSFQFSHPEWVSHFGVIGVSFWDLIQPAFMFMVGVAMPYSYARRVTMGQPTVRQTGHAAWRAIALVLLGVFLSSGSASQTNWAFTNVLSQIGLGYFFLYLLLPRTASTQVIAFVLILVGTWVFFESYLPPTTYDYAAVEAPPESVFTNSFEAWSKNANRGHVLDVDFLNKFPRQKTHLYNRGGYLTWNFIPSLATMLLGVFCGQILRGPQGAWTKLVMLLGLSVICMTVGVFAGSTVCPIVKRIWTPSWVLFSGGWVIALLAGFYFIFDLCRLKWLAFPLVVVGMNSIVMYLFGQLLRPWTIRTIDRHFGGLIDALFGPSIMADDMYGTLAKPTLAFIAFWITAFWMYRNKYFVRI